jgi:DNA end-binding protein Ku
VRNARIHARIREAGPARRGTEGVRSPARRDAREEVSMPRPIWKGSLTFGLVEIPVGLYGAETGKELHFTMLDRRDFSPVGYERVNKTTGEEVPWAEVVKGYELDSGEYVALTEEDFRQASPKESKTIEILEFVDAADVDLLHAETPYWIAPVKKDSKGYALLREALRRTGKVGIAKTVLRTRERLGAVVPRDDALAFVVLRFAEELRGPEGLELPAKDAESLHVTKKEIEMAEALVEGMTEDWDPGRHHDEYRERVLARIEEKAKAGKARQIEEPSEEEEPRPREVIDLMPLLKKSLEGRPARRGAKRDAPATRTVAAHRARPAGKPKTARRKTG